MYHYLDGVGTCLQSCKGGGGGGGGGTIEHWLVFCYKHNGYYSDSSLINSSFRTLPIACMRCRDQ